MVQKSITHPNDTTARRLNKRRVLAVDKTHNNEKEVHTNRKCILLDCHIDNRRHRHHNIDVDIRAR